MTIIFEAIAIVWGVFCLWGVWRIFPFFEIQEGDEGKSYFQQRIELKKRDKPSTYVPRWYVFPYFLNVTIFAAIACFSIWLLALLVRTIT